ncbi:MAG: hypothetical protein AAFO82_06925 [Bacteroidota bacterium]
MEDIKSKIKTIEDDISKNKLKAALNTLRDIFTERNASEEKNQCLQQINHYNRLQGEIRDRTITAENVDVQTNRIVKATLGLLSAAEKLLFQPKNEQTEWKVNDYEHVKPVGDIFEQFKQKWNTTQQEVTASPHGLTQILQEQFVDNRNNWNLGPINNFNQYVGNIAIANNQCSIVSTLNGSINAWIPLNINNFREFAIETQVHFHQGNNFGFGLIWGTNPNSFDSYYFLISPIGQFCIGYQMNGVSHNLANWMYSSYIMQGLNTNRLKIHRIGDQVHFYINNEHVFTTTYYQFFGNYLGMTAINYKTISFDYLKVWN